MPQWGKAQNTRPRKSLKLAVCNVCQVTKYFVGFRCVHCGARMPGAKPQTPPRAKP